MNTWIILHTVSEYIKEPVMWLLIILLVISAIMAGSFIAELLMHIKKKSNVQELISNINAGHRDALYKIIKNSNLKKIQSSVLLSLSKTAGLTEEMRTEAAQEAIAAVEHHYAKIINYTDLIIKIAPMAGLMGTLIPLGPGIMALGQGDIQTLSNSIITAFDTTVVGLVSAGIATVISSVRKILYKKYITDTEIIAECILEKMSLKNPTL